MPAVAFGFSDVWDQSVTYHSEATGTWEPVRNASKVASTFADRDLVLLLFAVLSAGCAAVARHAGKRFLGIGQRFGILFRRHHHLAGLGELRLRLRAALCGLLGNHL